MWMLFRCMVSNVLVFVSVIAALNSAVLLVAWQGRCVGPVLQRGSQLPRCNTPHNDKVLN